MEASLDTAIVSALSLSSSSESEMRALLKGGFEDGLGGFRFVVDLGAADAACVWLELRATSIDFVFFCGVGLDVAKVGRN